MSAKEFKGEDLKLSENFVYILGKDGKWHIAGNGKFVKYEDGKQQQYVRIGDEFVSLDNLVKKDDVLKLLTVIENYMYAMFQAKGNIGYYELQRFTKELDKIKEEVLIK